MGRPQKRKTRKTAKTPEHQEQEQGQQTKLHIITEKSTLPEKIDYYVRSGILTKEEAEWFVNNLQKAGIPEEEINLLIPHADRVMASENPAQTLNRLVTELNQKKGTEYQKPFPQEEEPEMSYPFPTPQVPAQTGLPQEEKSKQKTRTWIPLFVIPHFFQGPDGKQIPSKLWLNYSPPQIVPSETGYQNISPGRVMLSITSGEKTAAFTLDDKELHNLIAHLQDVARYIRNEHQKLTIQTSEHNRKISSSKKQAPQTDTPIPPIYIPPP
ncbi:MAG: hypothetical protein DRO11_00075 [Methanobacteriota archaeon]|nr:MAG: hypothetical protein DRO11_00075 [Euryarchaeota archaeon]